MSSFSRSDGVFHGYVAESDTSMGSSIKHYAAARALHTNAWSAADREM